MAALIFPAAGAPVRLEIDRAQSFIAVRVDKGGVFSFAAGHRHGILATDWSADVCWDAENPQASSAQITIPVASLRIDTEEARRKAGVEAKGPSPEDVKELQQKMLGARFLYATSYPDIRFQSTSVQQKDKSHLMLTGPITIRGKTRTVSAPVRLEAGVGGSLVFTGSFLVKQTDFGIKPESVGGVVTVKDAVDILFRFQGTPTTKACGR